MMSTVFASAVDLITDHGLLILLAVAVVYISHALGVFTPAVPRVDVPFHDVKQKTTVLSSPSITDPNHPGKIVCFNPSTHELLGYAPIMSPSEVKAAVNKARKAQIEWAKTNFEQRRHLLRIMLDVVVRHQEDICKVSAMDSGKTMVDAAFGEVITTCEKLRWVIAEGEAVLKPETRSVSLLTMHKVPELHYEPMGVVGAIAPWNYPFHNIWNPIISSLFCGNACVIKISEHTSWSASGYYNDMIQSCLKAAGAPSDLVQIVTGLGETGSALVSSGVDKLFFTGSAAVGRKVMETASSTLTPVVLELGGKDGFIVCDDADFDQAINLVMRGTYQNCGQNCIGVERVFVQDTIYDKFVRTVVSQVEQLRQGNPMGGQMVDCGAMALPSAPVEIQRLVDDAVAKGAKLMVGGNVQKGEKGTFYPPTVLAGVTASMEIANEEVFGPVMSIFRFSSDEEVVDMVNNCQYGLGSSVFSKNTIRAMAIVKKLKVGMSNINDFGVNYLCQGLPFGGVRNSGFDRFAGVEGLRGCCVAKAVTRDRIPGVRTNLPKPVKYPVQATGMGFTTGLITMAYAVTPAQKAAGLFKLITNSF